MSRRARILEIFFLFYFFVYAVSPLSAAVPDTEAGNLTEPQAFLGLTEPFPPGACEPFVLHSGVEEQTVDRVYPFVFDMMLWEILKKGKPSDDSFIDKVFLEKGDSKNSPDRMKCCVAEAVIILLSAFLITAFAAPEDGATFYTHTPSSYSGLSPPSV